MTKIITIADVYTAINPLPAMLSERGKAIPEVEFRIEANAGFCIGMNWRKRHSLNDWDKEYHSFLGNSPDEAVQKAVSFIQEMPSAEQDKLHQFMRALGDVIDAGKADGIAVDYLNPLLDSMKRLSENIITYKPQR